MQSQDPVALEAGYSLKDKQRKPKTPCTTTTNLVNSTHDESGSAEENVTQTLSPPPSPIEPAGTDDTNTDDASDDPSGTAESQAVNTNTDDASDDPSGMAESQAVNADDIDNPSAKELTTVDTRIAQQPIIHCSLVPKHTKWQPVPNKKIYGK